jgi:pilus assembly protein CpaC
MKRSMERVGLVVRWVKCLGFAVAVAFGAGVHVGFAEEELGEGTAKTLALTRGGSTRINVEEGIKRVVVGNDKVVDARPDAEAKSVLVTALAEGSSELRLERLRGGELVYRVLVRADLQGIYDEIQQLLGEVEGLEVKLLGDKILFKGRILTKADSEKVRRIADAYAVWC